jgi:hypothetical protein
MNDSLMSEPGDHGVGADFEEEDEEEEERILGPLGGAGLLALVTEVLCSCVMQNTAGSQTSANYYILQL